MRGGAGVSGPTGSGVAEHPRWKAARVGSRRPGPGWASNPPVQRPICSPDHDPRLARPRLTPARPDPRLGQPSSRPFRPRAAPGSSRTPPWLQRKSRRRQGGKAGARKENARVAHHTGPGAAVEQPSPDLIYPSLGLQSGYGQKFRPEVRDMTVSVTGTSSPRRHHRRAGSGGSASRARARTRRRTSAGAAALPLSPGTDRPRGG